LTSPGEMDGMMKEYRVPRWAIRCRRTTWLVGVGLSKTSEPQTGDMQLLFSAGQLLGSGELCCRPPIVIMTAPPPNYFQAVIHFVV
jgi:hypothetical protein